MARETEAETTDVRAYEIQAPLDLPAEGDRPAMRVWMDMETVDARTHAEALKIWALANAEEEEKYPFFRVGTSSGIKRLKGKPKPNYLVDEVEE